MQRHRRPSPVPLVVAAAFLLGALWFARGRLARVDVAPAPAVALDGAAYVRVVATTLRRAGCAAVACHGGDRLALHLAPALDDAAAVIDEFQRVRERVRGGDPDASPLYAKALGRGHGGGATLRADACEAAVLRAWIRGRVVRPCSAAQNP